MLLHSPLEAAFVFGSSLIGALSLLHPPPLKLSEEFQCNHILRIRGFTFPTLPYRNSKQGTNSQKEKKIHKIPCLIHPFEVQTLFHSHAFLIICNNIPSYIHLLITVLLVTFLLTLSEVWTYLQ
uniref:Uncharacterized protein n=1 Tax=Micrurus paraensis TaxID=1970185 RepID=A0A2D4K140_9SAUR